MATKEELEAQAKAVCATWASIIDSQLQDFLEKGAVNDHLGAAIAAVRLSQAAMMLSKYFQEVGTDLVSSDTELKAARQAVEQMHDTVKNRIAEALGTTPQASPSALVAELKGSPDRSMN